MRPEAEFSDSVPPSSTSRDFCFASEAEAEAEADCNLWTDPSHKNVPRIVYSTKICVLIIDRFLNNVHFGEFEKNCGLGSCSSLRRFSIGSVGLGFQ